MGVSSSVQVEAGEERASPSGAAAAPSNSTERCSPSPASLLLGGGPDCARIESHLPWADRLDSLERCSGPPLVLPPCFTVPRRSGRGHARAELQYHALLSASVRPDDARFDGVLRELEGHCYLKHFGKRSS